MLVEVSIALAQICFQGQCYNALIGKDTPYGEFDLSHRAVVQYGYGGDILVFREDAKYVWAIHRVWTLNQKENRMVRLQSSRIGDRYITQGCINIDPEVYKKLVDCCSDAHLIIK